MKLKLLLLLSLIFSLTSCGYTPSEGAKRAAVEAAFIYLNHELNAK